jgi:DNA-binding transcriptional regulator YdaS (Cro superfamily)
VLDGTSVSVLTLAAMESKSVKQQILDHFHGPSALAEKLGCTPQAISQWPQIPKGRAYQIEVLSGGHFTAQWILDEQKRERMSSIKKPPAPSSEHQAA